jgi:hypothetical protein
MISRSVAFLCVTLFAVSAGAQETQTPSKGDVAAAQLFFERGREAMDRGDAARACQEFAESLRLDLAVGTLFNLAKCEEAQGHLATAWQYSREGLNKLREGDPRRTRALREVDRLTPLVPRLRIVFTPAPGDGPVTVFRDSIELSSLSLNTAMPVDPGTHRIEVRAPGHKDATYDVNLKTGENQTVSLHFGERIATLSSNVSAAPTSVREPHAPRDADSSVHEPKPGPLPTIAKVSGILGLVSVGVGSVAGVMTLGYAKDVRDNCNAERICNGKGLDALDVGGRTATVSTVTFVVGGVLLATAIATWALSSGRSKPQASSFVLRF